jgi:hypothetical protein
MKADSHRMGSPCQPCSGVGARLVHDLELDSVRIGEEDRVVARAVTLLPGVVGGRVEHPAANLQDASVDLVDGRAALGMEREVVETRSVAVVKPASTVGMWLSGPRTLIDDLRGLSAGERQTLKRKWTTSPSSTT